MPSLKSHAAACAIVMTACASGKPPVVSPAAWEPIAQPAPDTSAHPEPEATKPEARCVGQLPVAKAPRRRPLPHPQPATCCYPDKEGIRRVIQAKYPALRQCYETALATSPELRGRLVVKFTIQEDGSVPMACDSGSGITDPQTLDCMLRAFTELRFPEQSGELCPKHMSIVYPIVFEPK